MLFCQSPLIAEIRETIRGPSESNVPREEEYARARARVGLTSFNFPPHFGRFRWHLTASERVSRGGREGEEGWGRTDREFKFQRTFARRAKGKAR